MAVLKKVRASTLMETLVATILIVVIFMLSGMLLNSLLTNTNKHNDDNTVRQELLLLQYQYKNGVLHLPYYSDLEHWEIEVVKEESNAMSGVLFVALHPETQKEISYLITDE